LSRQFQDNTPEIDSVPSQAADHAKKTDCLMLHYDIKHFLSKNFSMIFE
jgi:hypothetical protein